MGSLWETAWDSWDVLHDHLGPGGPEGYWYRLRQRASLGSPRGGPWNLCREISRSLWWGWRLPGPGSSGRVRRRVRQAAAGGARGGGPGTRRGGVGRRPGRSRVAALRSDSAAGGAPWAASSEAVAVAVAAAAAAAAAASAPAPRAPGPSAVSRAPLGPRALEPGARPHVPPAPSPGWARGRVAP